MGVIIPVAIFFWHVLKKRRLLKLVTKDIEDPDFFMPEPGYEMFHEGDGKYGDRY